MKLQARPGASTNRTLDRAYRFVRSLGKSRRLICHSSFAAAMQACETNGYSDADIVDVVVRKTQRYRDELHQSNAPFCLTNHVSLLLCSLLMARKGDEIRVLDFGGAAGAHYFNIRSLLCKSITLKWVVVETEEMVQQAEKHLASAELSFVTTIEQAAESLCRVDLATSSGAIQYLNDPIDYVVRLASCDADYISFDRLCLTRDTKSLYVTHKTFVGAHGPGPAPSNVQSKIVNVPSVIVQLSAFLSTLQERYSIIATQNDDSGILPVPGKDIVGLGCIARKI